MKLVSILVIALAYVGLNTSAHAEQVELNFWACVSRIDLMIVPDSLSAPGFPASEMNVSFERSPTDDGRSTVELTLRTYSEPRPTLPLSILVAKQNTHYSVGIVTSDEYVSSAAFQRSTYMHFRIGYTNVSNSVGHLVQTLDYFTTSSARGATCPTIAPTP